LGSGPNRIGQGIEFDYSCVHGVLSAREEGYETIMINCNPETVVPILIQRINYTSSLFSGSISMTLYFMKSQRE